MDFKDIDKRAKRAEYKRKRRQPWRYAIVGVYFAVAIVMAVIGAPWYFAFMATVGGILFGIFLFF